MPVSSTLENTAADNILGITDLDGIHQSIGLASCARINTGSSTFSA